MGRKRRVKKSKKRQRGGTRFAPGLIEIPPKKSRGRRYSYNRDSDIRTRYKPRLVDKIAEGAAMGLSGPSPSFIKLGAFLGKQVLKGIKDNVQHYRRRK